MLKAFSEGGRDESGEIHCCNDQFCPCVCEARHRVGLGDLLPAFPDCRLQNESPSSTLYAKHALLLGFYSPRNGVAHLLGSPCTEWTR